MTISLRCIASLIDDLLAKGYCYILTGTLQTDPAELNIGKGRGMGGGWFLVGLVDVIRTEGICRCNTTTPTTR